MAKSSSFFGLRTGSTKSLTFQVLRGQQITKDRVTKVSNPQSEAQMRQRALIPMVASARSELEGLVNHSWEGVNYGEESLRYFSKVNLTAGALSVSSYPCKNISNPGVANFIVSQGSINIPVTTHYTDVSNDWSFGFDLPVNTPTGVKPFPKLDVNTKGSTVMYYLAKYLAQTNNSVFANLQFTFLSMLLIGRVPVSIGIGEGEQAEVLQSGFNVQRLILPDPSSVVESDINNYHDSNDNFMLSSAVVDGGSTTVTLSDGAGTKIQIDVQENIFGFLIKTNGSPVGASLILSRLDNKTWRRSNSRLTIKESAVTPKFTFKDWFKFYDKAQVMRSDKYLNNGSQLPNVNG